MDLKFGSRVVGKVPDEKVEDHKPKPLIRHEVVHEFLLDQIEGLLRLHIRTPEEKARMIRALGGLSGSDKPTDADRTGDSTLKGSTGSKRPGRKGPR